MVFSFLFRVSNSIRSRWNYYVFRPYRNRSFAACGKNVTVDRSTIIAGNGNISIGDDVYIGPYGVIYSTRAEIKIGNHVSIGPKLSMISGDHRTDLVGEYMSCISEDDKLPENDRDIVIEDDVWMGVGVTVLKGVTIGHGSVIAAGAAIYRDIPPYSKVIAQNKILPRFTLEQIAEHERLLHEKYGQ